MLPPHGAFRRYMLVAGVNVVVFYAIWELLYWIGIFGIGFFLYMPDSLVSGTAAIDFGTRQGAGTASVPWRVHCYTLTV